MKGVRVEFAKFKVSTSPISCELPWASCRFAIQIFSHPSHQSESDLYRRMLARKRLPLSTVTAILQENPISKSLRGNLCRSQKCARRSRPRDIGEMVSSDGLTFINTPSWFILGSSWTWHSCTTARTSNPDVYLLPAVPWSPFEACHERKYLDGT